VETSEYQRCARILNGTSLVPPAWIQNSHTFMNSLGFLRRSLSFLPYHESAVSGTRALLPHSCQSPTRGATSVNDTTILVVDDEPQIRRVLRSTLSSEATK